MQTEQTALLVGLDIGGTKTVVLIADQSGCALGRAVRQTDTTTPETFLATISQTIQAALTEAKASPRQIRSIGVGVPGHVEPASGTVQLAVNLNMMAFPLGPAIAEQFAVPTLLENDVRTAAIGAFNYLTQTERIRHMAYISIGTGIAAGIVLNGRLYRGQNGMAGEIGHMMVEPNGELCNCGLSGCLETIVSGPAITRQMNTAVAQSGQTHANAGEVYRAAATGSVEAQKVIQRVSAHLCQAIQWLIMTYDVEKIVIGGGVSRSREAFLAPVLQEMALMRQHSTLAQKLLVNDKIVLIPADYSPGLWGAVHLAKQAVLLKEKLM